VDGDGDGDGDVDINGRGDVDGDGDRDRNGNGDRHRDGDADGDGGRNPDEDGDVDGHGEGLRERSPQALSGILLVLFPFIARSGLCALVPWLGKPFSSFEGLLIVFFSVWIDGFW
jgi:hypothetical protein